MHTKLVKKICLCTGNSLIIRARKGCFLFLGFFFLPNIRITAKGRRESSCTRYMRDYQLVIYNKNGEEGLQQKE